MLIVDALIHFGKGAPSRPHRPEPYSAEEAVAAMDQAGVDRALIHPVLWDPDSSGLAMQAEWMTDGSLDWLWPAAERAGVPVALAAALFLPSVGEIAEHHPGLKLIVDHMAVPPGTERMFWGADITRMPCSWQQCVRCSPRNCRGSRAATSIS
jgi:predicted TIM-barrel fold metal-dependent hydrolase